MQVGIHHRHWYICIYKSLWYAPVLRMWKAAGVLQYTESEKKLSWKKTFIWFENVFFFKSFKFFLYFFLAFETCPKKPWKTEVIHFKRKYHKSPFYLALNLETYSIINLLLPFSFSKHLHADQHINAECSKKSPTATFHFLKTYTCHRQSQLSHLFHAHRT